MDTIILFAKANEKEQNKDKRTSRFRLSRAVRNEASLQEEGVGMLQVMG